MDRIPALALLAVLFAATANSTVVTGNVSGAITDGQGAALARVVVTIAGAAVERQAVTSASGAYLFVELPPGDYVVQAESKSNGTIIRTSIDVDAGRTTRVDFQLDRAPDETVTESRETALLDRQKTVLTAPWNPTELSLLPLGRSPAALLDRVPGVATGAIDVGGSAIGTDLVPVVKGAEAGETEWTIDGVRAERGSQLLDFGLDSLQEIAVTTSGADVRLRAYGGEVSVMPRRGSGDLSGFASLSFSDADLVGRPEPRPDREGTRLDRLDEAALGLGGKLFSERANGFAAITARDIARVAWGGGPTIDDRRLHGFARADARPDDRSTLGLLFVGADEESGDTSSLLKAEGAVQLSESTHLAGFIARVDDAASRSTQAAGRGSYFLSGNVLQLVTFGVETDDGDPRARSSSFFAGDSISLSRVSLYAGIRADHSNGDGKARTIVAPRLSAAFEVPAERPTVLRVFAGRTSGRQETSSQRDSADEVLVDLEQQLVPELTFGVTATHRRFRSDSTSLNEVDGYVRKRLSNSFLVRGHVSWFDTSRPFVPAWSYALSGVAQLPRDMLVTFSWHGRDATDLDRSSAGLDLRFGKMISIDPFEATFAVDLFNATDHRSSSPRLVRLAATFRF